MTDKIVVFNRRGFAGRLYTLPGGLGTRWREPYTFLLFLFPNNEHGAR